LVWFSPAIVISRLERLDEFCLNPNVWPGISFRDGELHIEIPGASAKIGAMPSTFGKLEVAVLENLVASSQNTFELLDGLVEILQT